MTQLTDSVTLLARLADGNGNPIKIDRAMLPRQLPMSVIPAVLRDQAPPAAAMRTTQAASMQPVAQHPVQHSQTFVPPGAYGAQHTSAERRGPSATPHVSAAPVATSAVAPPESHAAAPHEAGVFHPEGHQGQTGAPLQPTPAGFSGQHPFSTAPAAGSESSAAAGGPTYT